MGNDNIKFEHATVFLREGVDALDVKPNGVYVDGTLGGGGHTGLILERMCESGGDANGRVIGIDRDESAILAVQERLMIGKKSENLHLVHDNFFNIDKILQEQLGDADKVIDGAILDLGVSSPQIDIAERGFSYNLDSRLDMRMDTTQKKSAYDVVNGYGVSDLARVIRDYGEERYALKIARMIDKVRPIETTFELVEAIKRAFPIKERYKDKHPAKRTFQAIRIEVNSELEGLSVAIEKFARALNLGGRLAIITFHSLEDRIVKQTFNRLCNPCTCPSDFPICVCGKVAEFELVARKPIVPSDDELVRNKRAHSAKLRVIRRMIRDK